MKKFIFTLIAVISFSFAEANNYTTETIVINGERNRVEVLTTLINDYLESQGKNVDIRKIYSTGHNDPSGLTLGKTDGTWTMVTHPVSGTSEFVQMSPKMFNSIVAILNNPISDVASGDVINKLCSQQKLAARRVANMVKTIEVEYTAPATTQLTYTQPANNDDALIRELQQQKALLIQALNQKEQQVVTQAPAPYVETAPQQQVVYVEKEVQQVAACGYRRNGKPRNCNALTVADGVNLALNGINTVVNIDTNRRVRRLGNNNFFSSLGFNPGSTPRLPFEDNTPINTGSNPGFNNGATNSNLTGGVADFFNQIGN